MQHTTLPKYPFFFEKNQKSRFAENTIVMMTFSAPTRSILEFLVKF